MKSKTSSYFLLIALIVICSCKKEESKNFILMGKVTDARTGSPMSNANVLIEQQLLEGGNFSGFYSTAVEGKTDASGHYHLEWENQNIVEARVTVSSSGYITRSADLNVSVLAPGKEVNQNLDLFPEAFVSVRAIKSGVHPNATQFNFRFENALFDCSCCNNDWRNYSANVTDSTFTCRVYGDTWLKYRYEVLSSPDDLLLRDSIYIPRNITSNLEINW